MDDDVQEPPYCGVQIYAGSAEAPPDYCENEVAPGFDRCPAHLDFDDQERFYAEYMKETP